MSLFKVAGNAMKYDAFISYRHRPDGHLAAAIQSALERFARRWYRPRGMRVFRDETDLVASPGLWPEVERCLEMSRWFILVASPESAESPWIQREITWWLSNHGTRNFIIALASGRIAWKEDVDNPHTSDFDWDATNALPNVLRRAFENEPLHVDLYNSPEAAPQENIDGIPLRSLAKIAAPILGRDERDLIGEYRHYVKRTRRLIVSVAASLSALVVLVSAAVLYASNQHNGKITQTRIAAAQRLATDSRSLLGTNLAMAQLLAVEAYHTDRDPQTTAALFAAVTSARRWCVIYRPAARCRLLAAQPAAE